MGGVVVVGILAAIAIPNFVEQQYRAKRAEVPSNVKGIKTAQIAYDAAFDTYIEVSSYKPSSSVGEAQRSWVSGTDFDTLGWMPDGKVRGAYKVTSSSSTDFRVTGICDVDGDGIRASFTATKSINTVMVTGATTY
jgi:type IV pilus assembly protein PilA